MRNVAETTNCDVLRDTAFVTAGRHLLEEEPLELSLLPYSCDVGRARERQAFLPAGPIV